MIGERIPQPRSTFFHVSPHHTANAGVSMFFHVRSHPRDMAGIFLLRAIAPTFSALHCLENVPPHTFRDLCCSLSLSL